MELMIVETTNVTIEPLPNLMFRFQVEVNIVPDTAVVADFQPYTECGLRQHSQCSNRASTPDAPYCELFALAGPALDDQGWVTHLDWDRGLALYTRQITLDQLGQCTGVKVTHNDEQGTILYAGTLVITATHARDCANESLCDQVRFTQDYDFEITIGSDGTTSVGFSTNRFYMGLDWVRNVWLPSGDMMVVVETHVDHVEGPGSTELCNGAVVHAHETGPRMEVLLHTRCTGTNEDADKSCHQIWYIGTQGGSGAGHLDFSGLKPLNFSLCVWAEPRPVPLHANLNLRVRRGSRGTQQFDDTLHSTALVFHDRNLTELYNSHSEGGSSAVFLDQDRIRVLLTLNLSPEMLKEFRLHVRRARLCTSTAASVHHCGDEGVTQYVLYDETDDNDVPDPQFNYVALRAPPSLPGQDAFEFTGHLFTEYQMILEILWRATPISGDGGGGAAGLVAVAADTPLAIEYSDSVSLIVYCPHGDVFYSHTCFNHFVFGTVFTHLWWIFLLFTTFFVLLGCCCWYAYPGAHHTAATVPRHHTVHRRHRHLRGEFKFVRGKDQ